MLTGKPISPGPLNSSAKKQRRVLESMVTSEGMCSVKHDPYLSGILNRQEQKCFILLMNDRWMSPCLRFEFKV